MPSFTRDRKCFGCVGLLENTVLFCSMRGEAAGTQDIIAKLTKPNNVSACLQRCFLSVTCLIQAFYDWFYVPITVQMRKSLMQENSGKEVDIREGGKELFSGWSHLVEKA